MPVESTETPTPATTQGSPAPEASSPVKEPVTPTPADSKPEQQSPQEKKQAAREAYKKQVAAKFADKPVAPAAPVEPAEPAAKERATPTPEATSPEAGTDPNPATPAAPAPSDDARRKDSIVIKDGEKDLTVTLDQAKQALLRDRFDAKIINKLTKTELLEVGAQRFLAQRKQDQFGSQAAQWRKAAEGGGSQPQTHAAAPTAPATPTATSDKASTAGSPAPIAGAPSQPPASPAPASQPEFTLDIDMSEVNAVAGEDVGDKFKPVLQTAARKILEQAQAQVKQVAETYQQQLQQQQQMVENLNALYWNAQFKSAFAGLEKDFPQVKDPDVQNEIKKNAYAIGQSGRYADPVASFETIVAEATHARLGAQTQETNARKALARQERRAAGQPEVVATRTETPSGAMSPADQKRAVLRLMQEKGLSPDQARQRVRDLQTAGG